MVDEGDSVEVVLTTMNGHFASLRFEPRETVTSVKQRVREEFGYPKDSQQLLLQGGGMAEEDSPLQSLPRPLLLSLVVQPFDKVEALLQAARDGHLAALRSLLFRVASDSEERRNLLLARTGDSMRNTALLLAADRGHDMACRALPESAPDVDMRKEMLAATDYLGCTALLDAAWGGHELSCRALFEFAPSLDERTEMLAVRMKPTSQTSLHLAASAGHETVSRAMLELAPNPELQKDMLLARDALGATALMFAAKNCHETVCRELLQWAQNIEVQEELLAMQNAKGNTALQLASGACRLLLDAF